MIKPTRSTRTLLLAGSLLAIAGGVSAQNGPGTPDGPSTANGGALTSCKAGVVLASCKPASTVQTTPVAKPSNSGETSTQRRLNGPAAHGDNGNHGTDGATPGSGAPGGSGMNTTG